MVGTAKTIQQGTKLVSAEDFLSLGSGSPFDMLKDAPSEALSEGAFRRMIAVERKRSERSKESFLLVILDTGNQQSEQRDETALVRIGEVLLARSRETDLVGWFKDKVALGVLFTSLEGGDRNTILSTILSRVKATIREALVFEELNQISISFHFFPDEWDQRKAQKPINFVLYPELLSIRPKRRLHLFLKRVIDIIGSSLALILLSPLFWFIAIAVKLTSQGPIFFSQTRVGKYGKPFILMKFRTMYTNIDRDVHKEFVTKLISDNSKLESPAPEGAPVYKLTNDTRITRVGRFLRRTSLDEIPQFLNVLRGEMSLVGPRPAVRYEVAVYETWHRHRILEFKPGITGLWQVSARSQVKFDDMVRLDLRYARMWSLWLDIKILLQTPLAVFKGTGAY